MEKIIEIIKQRILFAEKRMAEVTTREELAFWDGQMRCAQALYNEAHLTMLALDPPTARSISVTCPQCGTFIGVDFANTAVK